MKILFIGGTGVISTSITKKLANTNNELYLLNRSTGSALSQKNVKFIKADIRDKDQVKKVLDGYKFDVVVDFICYDKDNAKADYDLFKRKTNQFIFISSASCYQKPPTHYITDESTPLKNPFWDYSQQKIKCEHYFMKKYMKEDFPVTIVRPSHTYAKDKIPMALGDASSAWTYIYMILNEMPIVLPGDGTTLWTVTHSDDFADGFIGLIGNQSAIGHSFTITSDEVLTWNAITEQIGMALDKKPNIVYISSDTIVNKYPELVGPLFGDKSNCAIFDNSKIKNFVPTYRPSIKFAEGIKQVVDYYLNNKDAQVLDNNYINMINELVNISN